MMMIMGDHEESKNASKSNSADSLSVDATVISVSPNNISNMRACNPFHPYHPNQRFNGHLRFKSAPRVMHRLPWPGQFPMRLHRPGKERLKALAMPPVPPGVNSEIWEWFYNADEDKDGCVTAGEVQRILLNGKWRPFNEETCKMMVYMMDTEKTDNLDAYEMSALWKYLIEWKKVFDSTNEDGGDTMKSCKLFKALESLGYRLSSELCDAVVARFDDSGDGKLSFNDFIQTCIMLRSLTEAFKVQDTCQEGIINLHFEQFIEMVLDNAMGFTRSTGLSS